jgi:hypothetical protein
MATNEQTKKAMEASDLGGESSQAAAKQNTGRVTQDSGVKVRVAATRNSAKVSFPDGEGGVDSYAAGETHTVPADLADAVDPWGERYFDRVENKNSE